MSQIQNSIEQTIDNIWLYFQTIPGSAIVIRYIKSSYQNDPIRSVIELFLFLFAMRYLLSPSYSVQKSKGFVEFNEDVCYTAASRLRLKN